MYTYVYIYKLILRINEYSSHSIIYYNNTVIIVINIISLFQSKIKKKYLYMNYNGCHSINKLMADHPKFQFLWHFINKTL